MNFCTEFSKKRKFFQVGIVKWVAFSSDFPLVMWLTIIMDTGRLFWIILPRFPRKMASEYAYFLFIYISFKILLQLSIQVYNSWTT